MLDIYIHGLADGIHTVEATCRTDELPDMPEEFFGEVKVEGSLRVLGKRYSLKLKASCRAKFLCDVSLEEYEDEVSSEFSLSYIADNDLYDFSSPDDRETSSGERIIHSDEKTIDVSEDVREELCVNMPMKRVSPAFRDKDILDLFPELKPKKTVNAEENDGEVWAKLKNLKLN